MDRLERTVKELAGQVRTLSLIMDEIRDELIYAVRNDRFNAIPEATWQPIEPATPGPVNSPSESPRATTLSPTSKPAAAPTVAQPRRPSTLFG